MNGITNEDYEWADAIAATRSRRSHLRRCRDDLESAGRLALIATSARFPGASGDELRAIAYRAVAGAVGREAIAARTVGGTGLHRAIRRREGFPLMLSIDSEGGDGQTIALDLQQRPEHRPHVSLDADGKARLLAAVRALPSPHRAIVAQRFGVLSCWGSPASVATIARQRSRSSPRDWTPDRVGRVVGEALEMLRHMLADSFEEVA